MDKSKEQTILTHRIYAEHARFLWGLTYRMTGSASDAEDIVQEVFVRALEKPPADQLSDWKPWLIRVAVNLCRDQLRKRKKQGYSGPWLPSPIPTDEPLNPIYEPCTDSASARYDLQESVTFAFLLSLEALNPTQRAVLLLRDVFDYSTREVATVLKLAETTVKVTLHRARRNIRAYSEKPKKPKAETLKVLQRFLQCLQMRDASGLEKLLCEDVIVCSDGGGEVVALHALMKGRQKAMQLLTRLNELYRDASSISFCELNGSPSILIEHEIERSGHASRLTMQCEIDSEGRIDRLNFVLAPSKLKSLKDLAPVKRIKLSSFKS